MTTCSRTCARSRSRSPTACSAASPRPKTSSRRRSCACTPRSRGASGSSRRARTSPPSRRASPSISCGPPACAASAIPASGSRSRWSADAATDPAARAELADSLSLAFLVLLERLTPEQRAVLLLRDVFHYGYGEIAAIVGKSEANVRQLAVRARRQVEEGRPRFEASRERRDELAARFLAATRDGDLPALEALLARDVVLHGDGGGKVPALARALHGRARVARTLVAWGRQGRRGGRTSVRPRHGQRPARGGDRRRGGARARRAGARHPRRPRPGRAVDRQSRQAGPRRPRRRHARGAARGDEHDRYGQPHPRRRRTDAAQASWPRGSPRPALRPFRA